MFRNRTLIRCPAWILILSAVSFIGFSSIAESTNPPFDAISFFKEAISSPPDIESYIVGQRELQPLNYGRSTLRTNTVQYFQGARSGTNYFLRFVSNSNAVVVPDQKRDLIAGRAGGSMYEIGYNVISYGLGTSPVAKQVGNYFNFTRQFLNMGMADIVSESVVWTGNAFEGKNNSGQTRYGELVVSNNLPSKLLLRDDKNAPPYKLIEYIYSDPVTMYAGFPSKIFIFKKTADGFNPSIELTFHYVLPATQALPDSFFSDAKFLGSDIKHTNIYSNADLYVYNTKRGLIKASNAMRSDVYGHTKPRLVIYFFLALVTIISIIVVSLLSYRKK